MTVERAPGDAEPFAHGSQREMLHANGLDGAHGLIQKGPTQVPVMVGLSGLIPLGWVNRTNHTKIIAQGVDSVNMSGYIDVDSVHIERREHHAKTPLENKRPLDDDRSEEHTSEL